MERVSFHVHIKMSLNTVSRFQEVWFSLVLKGSTIWRIRKETGYVNCHALFNAQSLNSMDIVSCDC